MTEKASHFRWKILTDEEVTRREDDAFGVHTAYAELLQQIATDCPTPFSIGLYSNWGTGKTSIIRLLQELVSKDRGSSLTVIYLDVWKYSSDPLKRWILLETERQLAKQELLKNYEFQGRSMQSHLEFEEDIEDKDRLEIDFRNFKRLTILLALTIALSVVAWILVPETWKIRDALRWILTLSAGSGVVALVITAAMKKMGESLSGLIFRRTIRHVTAKPAFSSEKFAGIFRDLVSKVSQGENKRRLVFVFDNLDRCQADVAVEVIGVVKTCLDEPGCVYVIPCDEEAILTHIKNNFVRPPDTEASDFHANQFLTKFFQLTLRLPPAADFAVEDYLDKELKEAKMEDLTTDARDVLVLGYRGETPRQVKRVLNDLIAYRGIAEQIEADNLVEAGALTSDLGHLTKMAVLSVKWPSFMRRLADDPILWTDVMQRVRSQSDAGMEDLTSDLQQFLWNTRLVSPDADIRPWLYFRRGALERDAPLNRRIVEILQNGASKLFLDLLADQALQDKKKEILQIVSSALRRWLTNDRRVLLRNGGPVVVKASLAVPDNNELRRTALDVLEYLAANASAEEMEQLFDVKDILSITKTSFDWQRDKLLTKYVELFETRYPTTDGRMEIWKQLLQHGDLLSGRDQKSVSNDLVNRYSLQPSGENDVLSLLQYALENPVNRGWAVTAKLLTSITALVSFDGSEPDKKRLNALVAFRKVQDKAAQDALLVKLAVWVSPSRISQADQAAQNAISTLFRFEPDSLSRNQLAPIIESLLAQANRSAVAERSWWFAALLHLYPVLAETDLAAMDALFKSTLVDSDPNQSIKFLSGLNKSWCKRLLRIDRFIIVFRMQPANYQGRYAANAIGFREQHLDAFDARDILSRPSIFEESLSWDLSLFVKTASRALKEKTLSTEEAGQYVESFCRKYLPESAATQKELYASLLQFLTDHPDASRVGLADIVATCELAKVLAGEYSSFLRFAQYKAGVPLARRLELSRQLLQPLSARTESWVQLLVLLVNDLSGDEELSKNASLVGDLADYSFSAAREKWTEIGEALANIVAFLGESQQQDYVDRSLDALLSLEADGEDLPKMEPYLKLVTAFARHVDVTTSVKAGKFVQRMLGAARPDEAKLRTLQFASGLNVEVLVLVKQSIEPLAESAEPNVSAAAKAILLKVGS
jgi:hypothetical protein